jgi:hypothetical protein
MTSRTFSFTVAPPVSPQLLFFDSFNYVAPRGTGLDSAILAQKRAAFQAAGWNGVADTTLSAGRLGFIYTTDTIPGYSGPMPGSSPRVLCLERLGTQANQSDIYISYGDVVTATRDKIPGDVWIQYWLYQNYSGSQLSNARNDSKFLYVSNDAFPSHNHMWMGSLGTNTAGLYSAVEMPGTPGNVLPNIAQAISNLSYPHKTAYSDPGGDLTKRVWLGCGNTNGSVRSDVDPNTGIVAVNRWTLVKQHMNTNNASIGNAYECWLRAYGRPSFTKVAEFISGTTPDFEWTIGTGTDSQGRPCGPGGHRAMQMPSTSRATSWTYMADFAIATTESALPVYGN